MALVTGGMGGLGSICSFICASEGMGPIMTTSRTGALPGGQAQLSMLEAIMDHTPHISVKCDMSRSDVVADLLAWCQKMGRTRLSMEQQVVNIDEINTTLKAQMGFSGKRNSNSLKSTVELMTWIRNRYAAALIELRQKIETGKSGAEVEDALGLKRFGMALEENEAKVGEAIAEIKKKLDLAEGAAVSAGSLRQVRMQAAQLSQTVASVERLSKACSSVEELAVQVRSIKSEKRSPCRQWVVVGGCESGGITVQLGSEDDSAVCRERLATGARVEEVSVQGGKVLFSKIEGAGPACGWAPIALYGASMLSEAIETELE